MPGKPDVKKLEEKIISLEKTIESLNENESILRKENNELKEIKKYYDVLMQNTDDYILVCDRNGIPQAFNSTYKEIVESLLGIEMKPGVQPFKISDKAKAREYWESLQQKALSGEKFIAEYFDDEGEEYFETIFCPVKEGEKVTGFTEITRNITDRKKAEKELEESNSFRSTLLEHAPIAILVYDPDTAIMYVNSLFEKLTGFTNKEMRGIKIPYPWWVNDPEYGTVEQRKNSLLEGVSGAERRFQKKNGEYSWVEVNTAPIYCNGELKYILAMWVDISDRKKAEQEKKILQEKLQRSLTMESLGLLAGGVAHDLNNVLTGIVSYPELLIEKYSMSDKLRKSIKIIKEAGDRAAAIVQDLLTIARGVAIEKNVLNLNILTNDYLGTPEFEKLQQYHPSVTIKTELDSNLLNIKGAYIHLRKVLMNLVSNASEAIDGTGSVTISTKNCFLDRPLKGFDHVEVGEYAVISVADNGTGISPEDLKRIFEPFYTKKVMGRSGTGLGLAVVWNVMREHNGYINIKNDKKGTTFELYFPITREDLPDHDSEIPLEDIKGNGQKILIVDDVESQRHICSQILEKLGYKVHTTASGEKAVEYLKHNTVDLVLLDMLMDPGINGLETYKRILKINPYQKAVLFSGYVATDEVKKAQELGAGPLLKKPVTLQRLGTAIKEELNKN
jgi:PAS domain S-box-containing protein